MNENIRALELQLMGNDIADFAEGSNVLQELEDSHAQHGRIVESLRRKQAALGVDERMHLTVSSKSVAMFGSFGLLVM